MLLLSVALLLLGMPPLQTPAKPILQDPDAGTLVLFENWEGDGIDPGVWNAWGDPAPRLEPGLGEDGSVGLNCRGDAHCNSGVTSLQTFDLSRGLRVRWRARCPHSEAYEWFQQVAGAVTRADLNTDGVCSEGNYRPLARIWIDAPELGQALRLFCWHPAPAASSFADLPYLGNVWATYEIIVHRDGFVSFWVDGALGHVTEEPIDLALHAASRIQFSGQTLVDPPEVPIVDEIEVFTDVFLPSPSLSATPGDTSAPPLQPVVNAYVDGYLVPAFLAVGEDLVPFLADLDGDLDLDLLIGRLEEPLAVFLNVGLPHIPVWSRSPTNYIAAGSGNVSAPCLSDLDGDGDLDGLFVVYSHLEIYRNTGGPNAPVFEWAETFTNFPPADSVVNARFADLDADGDEDLLISVVKGGADPYPQIEYIERSGTPAEPVWTHRQSLFYTDLFPFDGDHAVIDVMDVDNDGLLDLVAGFIIAPEYLHVARNTGTAADPDWAMAVPWAGDADWGLPACTHGDLDADGHEDVLVGSSYGRITYLKPFPPYGLGDWRQAVHSYVGQDLGDESVPCLADLDGDADLDLLVGVFSGRLLLLENEGNIINPRWRSPRVLLDLPVDLRAAAPAAGDLDLDGDMDVVVGDLSGRLTVCWNDGTNGVPAWIRIEGGYGGIELGARARPALFDPDGDGDLDLVVGDALGRVHSFENAAGAGAADWRSADCGLGGIDVGSAASPFVTDLEGDGQLDLLVGSAAGVILRAVDSGGAGSPCFAPISSNALPGAATPLSAPAAGDIDGDGDVDLFIGSWRDGLGFRRNTGPVLALYPPRVVVPTSGMAALSVSGQVGEVTWTLLHDGSGATLEVCASEATLHAGTTAHAVDVVEAVDEAGVRGRSYIHVLHAEDLSKEVKAVIVAGGKRLDDPVWQATGRMADQAYGMLRNGGYARSQIRYHRFGPDHDVDGNGLFDEVHAGAGLLELEETFTAWAADAAELFVYLVDHGAVAQGEGRFYLSADETLGASELGTWLDQLQAADTNLTVTVVLDFCYAGRFLGDLAHAGPGRRIVLASTGEDELAYFVAGGVVSFSQVLFSALRQGLDMEAAFRLARDTMTAYPQQACMDDDGDGVYRPDRDGAVAAEKRLQPSRIAGADRPQIGGVEPMQILDGTTRATLRATEVSAAQALTRVWCAIIPPHHGTATNSSDPVVDIPLVQLLPHPDEATYENVFDGFSEPGLYALIYYAEDVWGGMSLPVRSHVLQGGFDERLILAAGGTSDTGEWSNAVAVAEHAYAVFQSRLFQDDRIQYLREDAASSAHDVDGVPTRAALWMAVTNWAGASDRLILYLAGQGTSGAVRLNDTEVLGAGELDALLDAWQTADREVTVVLEFDGSGGCLGALTPPAGRTRISIASSRTNRISLAAHEGRMSFSSFLLSGLAEGRTLGASVDRARKATRRASGNLRQKAMIDDDGDGLANEKNVDGRLAATRHLGSAFVTGDDVPSIAEVVPEAALTNTSWLLYADGVSDADGVSNVWVEVTPPTNSTASVSARVDLSFNAAAARWEAEYAGFAAPGIYGLSFYAMDRHGNRSAAVQSRLLRTDDHRYASVPGGQPDGYEPDDDPERAVLSDLPLVQTHTLHAADDCDWVRFYASASEIYDIETVHLDATSSIDTVIEVYREEPDGTRTLVDRVDEFGRDEGELTGLDFPADGFYLVRVCQAADPAYAQGAYLLVVYVPAGFAGVNARALDMIARGALAGATVHLKDGLGALLETRVTDAQGYARFTNAPPAEYRVQVLPPEAPGTYLRRFNPNSASEGPDDPASPYGNERWIGEGDFAPIAYDGSSYAYGTYLTFEFIPVAYLEGRVLNGLTGEGVEGAVLRLRDVADGRVYDGYPWTDYAAPWRTEAGGAFPYDLILPPGTNLVLQVDGAGFLDYTHPAGLTSPPRGGTADAGDLPLAPSYGGNAIPDYWELAHGLATNVDENLNTDGDAFTHGQEWLAGTDPGDGSSYLAPRAAPAAPSGMRLQWPASPSRWYRVWRTEDLTDPSGWAPVHGPVRQDPHYGWMEWIDADSAFLPGAHYRLEVMGP